MPKGRPLGARWKYANAREAKAAQLDQIKRRNQKVRDAARAGGPCFYCGRKNDRVDRIACLSCAAMRSQKDKDAFLRRARRPALTFA